MGEARPQLNTTHAVRSGRLQAEEGELNASDELPQQRDGLQIMAALHPGSVDVHFSLDKPVQAGAAQDRLQA